jgi:hypothetical protein
MLEWRAILPHFSCAYTLSTGYYDQDSDQEQDAQDQDTSGQIVGYCDQEQIKSRSRVRGRSRADQEADKMIKSSIVISTAGAGGLMLSLSADRAKTLFWREPHATIFADVQPTETRSTETVKPNKLWSTTNHVILRYWHQHAKHQDLRYYRATIRENARQDAMTKIRRYYYDKSYDKS